MYLAVHSVHILQAEGDRHLLEQAELSQLLLAPAPLRMKSVEVAESSKGALPDIMQNRVSLYIFLLFLFSFATLQRKLCNCRKLPAPFANRLTHKASFISLICSPAKNQEAKHTLRKKGLLKGQKRGKHTFLQGLFCSLSNCHIWQTYKKPKPNQQNQTNQPKPNNKNQSKIIKTVHKY